MEGIGEEDSPGSDLTGEIERILANLSKIFQAAKHSISEQTPSWEGREQQPHMEVSHLSWKEKKRKEKKRKEKKGKGKGKGKKGKERKR